MTLDPKRLEAGTELARKRATEIGALTLAVINGHWAINEAVDNFLTRHEEEIETDSFSKKAKACEDLGHEKNDQHWKILWAADSLRNELAHKRDPEKIKTKTANLRAEYMKVLSIQQAKGLEAIADDIVAQQACISVAGFLYAVGEVGAA